jgi:proline dehydrogenase
LVPDADALENFSTYLVRTRAQLNPPIPHPGTARSTDLVVLQSPTPSKDLSPLTAEDIAALRELREDLWRICTKARERGVKLIMDAEYT